MDEEKYKKTIKINNSRKVYTSSKDNFDITFIQILDNDGIKNLLEIDEEINDNNENYLNN